MMRGAGVWAWLALMMAACGDEPSSPPASTRGGISSLPVSTRSGERLKARFWSANEAAEKLETFVDTKLDAPCSFRLAGDGLVRCVPDVTALMVDVFSDMGCQTLLATSSKTACARVKLAEEVVSCPPSSRVFSLGAETTPTVVYTRATTGECIAQAPDAETTYWVPGPELAPTDLVGSRTKDIVDEGLATAMLEGNDGSRTFAAFRDVKRNAECVASRTSDGTRRCVPRAAASIDTALFADGACGARAASFSGCGSPDVAVETDACGTSTRVFRIGARVDAPHQRAAGACAAITSVAPVFGVGAEIAPPELPILLDVPDLHGFRIIPRQLSAPGGPVTTGFFDIVKGVECAPALAEDGVLRCLPTALGPNFDYRDASCTSPVVSWTCAEAAPRFAFEYVDAEVRCDRKLRIHVRGDEVPVADVYRRYAGGECAKGIQPAGAKYFEVGAVVPAAELAMMTRVTR